MESALVRAAPPRPAPRAASWPRSCTRPSPTGARRWPARSRWRPARPTASATRARAGARASSATRPTRAPSGSRRRLRRAGRRARPDAAALRPRRARADRRARLREGQPRAARRAAARRRPAPALLALRLARPRRRRCASSRPTAPTRSMCPGVDGPRTSPRARSTAFRGRAGAGLPPLRVAIDKRIPVAAGLGGGSADAAAVLRAANGSPAIRSSADELRAARRRARLRRAEPDRAGHALVTGVGRAGRAGRAAAVALVLVPAADGPVDRGRVRRARPARRRRARELDPEPLRALAARPLAGARRARSRTTSSRRRSRCGPS